jgi:hypothetical protein
MSTEDDREKSRIVTWHVQHRWNTAGSDTDRDAGSPFRGAVAHDRHQLDCLSDGRGSFAIQAILPCLARAYKVMPAMVILR